MFSSAPRSRSRAIVAASTLVVAGLLASGCASTKSSAAAPSAGGASATQADPKSLVPAALKASGKINIATDATYAPNEYVDTDGKTIIGMDIDLGNEVAKRLGLTATFQNVTFDAIIPGMVANKYDMSLSSFTDTKAREGAVDFVTYLNAGTSMMVKKGNPETLSLADLSLCGKTVSVEKGTTQESTDVPALSKKCTAAGKPAVKVDSQDDQNKVNESLDTGRSDAYLADSPVAGYAAKQSADKFQLAGDATSVQPYGIAINKSQAGLKDAVLAAMKAMVADGTYKTIITKWGEESGAITTPMINGALS